MILYILYHSYCPNIRKWCHWNGLHSSRRWQRAIIVYVVCCINIVVQLWCCIFPIKLFYIINRFFEKGSTGFVTITSKKVSLSYVLEQSLFLRFDRFYFSVYLDPLYFSYWLFIYIKFCSLFQISDSIPIMFTTTAYHRRDSSTWKYAIIIFCLLYHYSHTITALHGFD